MLFQPDSRIRRGFSRVRFCRVRPGRRLTVMVVCLCVGDAWAASATAPAPASEPRIEIATSSEVVTEPIAPMAAKDGVTLSLEAVAMARDGDLPRARDLINAALAWRPLAEEFGTALQPAASDVVRANHAVILLYEAEYPAALRLLDELIALDPAPPRPLLLNRSLALRALGRYDEASRDYRAYLGRDVSTDAMPPLPPAPEVDDLSSGTLVPAAVPRPDR